MLNAAVASLVLIVNFIFQSTFLQLVEIRGVIPDTMIIIIVSYALLRGQNTGMAVGVAAGLIYDVFFGNSIGFYALLGLLTGLICGTSSKTFYRENYVMPVLLSFLANCVIGMVVYVTSFLLKNDYNVFYYVFNVILPQAVYTGVAAVFIYRILYSINKKVEKKEREKRRVF